MTSVFNTGHNSTPTIHFAVFVWCKRTSFLGNVSAMHTDDCPVT